MECYKNLYTVYVYIYIYMCVCGVCVRVFVCSCVPLYCIKCVCVFWSNVIISLRPRNRTLQPPFIISITALLVRQQAQAYHVLLLPFSSFSSFICSLSVLRFFVSPFSYFPFISSVPVPFFLTFSFLFFYLFMSFHFIFFIFLFIFILFLFPWISVYV